MKFRRILLAALAVFAFSYLLDLRGIRWEFLHPDEYQIAKWVKSTRTAPYIRSRVYPEGLFRISGILQAVDRLHDRAVLREADWERQGGDAYPRDGAEETPPLVLRSKTTTLLRVRYWNAALVSFAAVFVLLLGLETTRRVSVSVLAAMLFAAHPFVVEHAHYAETEGAMIFATTLALWLLSRAIRKESIPLLAAAALCAGFAIASKFSLLLFTGLLPVNAFLVARRKGHSPWMALLFAAAALAVVGLGFTLATPKLWMDPGLFARQLARIRGSSYGEVRRLLGESRGRPHARLVLKARSLWDELSKFGLPWLLWTLGASALWFRRRLRPLWPALPLFGLAYPVYALILFPWFRNQELLPALPYIALTTVLPLEVALSRTGNPAAPHRYRDWLWRIPCILIPLFFVGRTFREGVFMSGAFATREMRAEVDRWLDLCGPERGKFLVENYAGLHVDMARSTEENAGCSKIEFVSPDEWESLDCDFLLRAPDFPGRGCRDPKTGDLYPSCRANRDRILPDLLPLRSWHLADGPKPLFAQVEVDLLGRGHPGSPTTEPPALAPLFIRAMHYGTGGMHVAAGQERLGPIEALKVTGRRTEVTFSPPTDGGSYANRFYGVAINFSRNASVKVAWNRGFAPLVQEVPAGGATLFRSTASLKSPFSPVGSARVRLLGDDQTFHTLVVFTADASRAAALLRAFGNADAAGALEVETGHLAPLPESLVADFSHAAFGPVLLRRDAVPFDPLQANREGFLYADLPFIPLQGQDCTLRLRITGSWHFSSEANASNPAAISLPEFTVDGVPPRSATALGWDDTGALVVDLALGAPKRPSALRLGVRAPDSVNTLALSNAELRWETSATDWQDTTGQRASRAE